MQKLRAFFLVLFVTLSSAALAEGIPHVNMFNFPTEVAQAPGPVLVQFDAKWCPYCRALQPALERLQQSGASGMKIVKVDVDQDPGLQEKFSIRSLPTLIVVYKGGEFARHEGAIKEEKLGSWVASAAAAIESVK